MRKFLASTAAAAMVLGIAMTTAPAAAEESLRVLTTWGRNFPYTKDFLGFVAKVNERGKGIVKIDYLGGPEVTKGRKQPQALRRGIVDMHFGAATHYIGIIPEADALLGASISPSQARARGGIKLLNERSWHTKLGAHLLAWSHTGSGFYIYLKGPPKRDKIGIVDLSGLKIRTSPTYREFLVELGATPIVMRPGELLTAMERGVIDGTAWPGFAVPFFGWHKYARYRVEPQYLQSPVTTQVNLKKWQSLSQRARDILQKAAIEFEQESRAKMAGRVAKEQILLRDKWEFKIVAQPGEAGRRYTAMAYDVVWRRLTRNAPDNVEKLRKIFYK